MIKSVKLKMSTFDHCKCLGKFSHTGKNTNATVAILSKWTFEKSHGKNVSVLVGCCDGGTAQYRHNWWQPLHLNQIQKTSLWASVLIKDDCRFCKCEKLVCQMLWVAVKGSQEIWDYSRNIFVIKENCFAHSHNSQRFLWILDGWPIFDHSSKLRPDSKISMRRHFLFEIW